MNSRFCHDDDDDDDDADDDDDDEADDDSDNNGDCDNSTAFLVQLESVPMDAAFVF